METDRIVVIRRRNVIRGWCQECAGEVDMLNVEDAAAIVGMPVATLGDSSQARTWHVCQGSEGATLVCLESLLKSM